MSKYLFIALMTFVIVCCAPKGYNIEGEWESVNQSEMENHIVYIFTQDMKYQVIVNGEEQASPLEYKIEGDTIIMDRGEHWIPIVGVQNRYIKEQFSVSKKSEGTILSLEGLEYRRKE